MVKNDFWRGKRVFITGHTGFKGSWLSLWLYELGAKVVGYALKPPTEPNLFETCSLERKITSILGDIRDLKNLRKVIEGYKPEIVFHMAAQSLVRYSYRKPVETYETNVIGTVNLLEACRYTSSIKVIINVTSDKCYENREQKYGYKENDPMGGYDPYSSSKGCAELVTSAYRNSFFNPKDFGKTHNVALASVRAGNVIGGGDWSEDRLIPDCIKSLSNNKTIIIRNPDAVRPWQFVLDPLSGYILLAQHLYQDKYEFCGAWNFGPDDNDIKTVEWIVKQICAKWGNKASYKIDKGKHPHEARCLKLDCSKAKSKLGWYPRLDLDLAMQKTIEWYKAYYNNENVLNITINQIKSYEKCIQEKVTQK